jgi:hypothetical protein
MYHIMLFIFIFKNINYATLLHVSVYINKLGDSAALRARAQHAPVFLGSLTRKTGRYMPPPPHASFTANPLRTPHGGRIQV